MTDEKKMKDVSAKVRETLKSCYTYQLDQDDLNEIAKRIGLSVLENVVIFSNKLQRGKIAIAEDCFLANQCKRGGVDFDCPAFFAAYECAKDFNCGGKGKDTFNCQSGWFDDFDCLNTFQCGGGCGPFNCVGKYNDDDCGDKFCCDNKHFDCESPGKYTSNSTTEEAVPHES